MPDPPPPGRFLSDRAQTTGPDHAAEQLRAWLDLLAALAHLVTTEQHAVALLTLRALEGEVAQEWQQVAVYRVEKGQIREIWAFEDERKR